MRALLVLAANILAGCTVYSQEIPGEYASAGKYRLYNCEHVERERYRIHVRTTQIAAILDQFARSDPPRNGIALWPEYARLKGEHAALERTAMSRECALVKTLRTEERIPALPMP